MRFSTKSVFFSLCKEGRPLCRVSINLHRSVISGWAWQGVEAMWSEYGWRVMVAWVKLVAMWQPRRRWAFPMGERKLVLERKESVDNAVTDPRSAKGLVCIITLIYMFQVSTHSWHENVLFFFPFYKDVLWVKVFLGPVLVCWVWNQDIFMKWFLVRKPFQVGAMHPVEGVIHHKSGPARWGPSSGETFVV